MPNQYNAIPTNHPGKNRFSVPNKILGIDPGSRITGYGLIEHHNQKSSYVNCGCIRTNSAKQLAERLKTIFENLLELIAQYQPDSIGIEQVFMSKNADSALKLGQARGAAIVAGASAGIPVFEYSARQIKQSVVGTGGADKKQVQHMVTALLGLNKSPASDAADALAVALCHANTQTYLSNLSHGQGFIRMGKGKLR